MQITRNHHIRHMAKITPFLIILYIAQVIIYQRFAPESMRGDINLYLGLGLSLIILCYHFYDLHHKIILHQNYIEISFEILGIKEEILYQNINQVEVKKNKRNFGQLVLHLRDGREYPLYHVDTPEKVVDYLKQKKIKNF